jgi:hypothetical protein
MERSSVAKEDFLLLLRYRLTPQNISLSELGDLNMRPVKEDFPRLCRPTHDQKVM